jgi:hypothetical protein
MFGVDHREAARGANKIARIVQPEPIHWRDLPRSSAIALTSDIHVLTMRVPADYSQCSIFMEPWTTEVSTPSTALGEF